MTTRERIVEINLTIPGGILLLAVALAAFLRAPVGAPPLHWAIATALALLALCLVRTIVDVRPHQVAMRFTLPWPRHSIELENVDSFRIVDIPWWVGWGFRWWPRRGWCWRAAGSRGIEFSLRHGGDFVLGCKDPEGVVEVMNRHSEWADLRVF